MNQPPEPPPVDNRTTSRRIDAVIRDERKHMPIAEIASERRSGGWCGEEKVRKKLAKIMQCYPGIIPEDLFETLVDHYLSPNLSDGSASSAMSSLESVCIIAKKRNLDPTSCGIEEFLQFAKAYRNGEGRNQRAKALVKKTKNQKLQVSSIDNVLGALRVLHLASGNDWIRDVWTDKQADRFSRLKASWAKEDNEEKGTKTKREPRSCVPLGYTTSGEVTLADLVVYRASSPRQLRDQCWVLLAGETGMTMPQLRMLACSAVDVGGLPSVLVPKRADSSAPVRRMPISRELARLLRRLIDSVSKDQSQDAHLFQSLAKQPDAVWSGEAMSEPSWSAALRAVMTSAAETSPFRRAQMAAVMGFIGKLTPKSPGQGLIQDCLAAGFQTPAVTAYIGLTYVDRVYSIQQKMTKRDIITGRL